MGRLCRIECEADRDQAVRVAIIIGIEPQLIIIGIPAAHIAFMRSAQAMNISIDMPSIGPIVMVMPSAVVSQVILAIITGIGIMPPIIGIIMPGIIMLGIMPGIIGIGIGFMAFGMPIIGIMGIIGICMAGVIGVVLRWSAALGCGAGLDVMTQR
ncbi:hypothetical protein [Siculibacillus lacustris]|uniref:hypothetical protein n=1 Tax=Siculibacillus lacustris TaxID=1549641 RepID=UPI0019D2E52B|nr:hypothetical protein [Siculibacillus lacustris]